MSIVGALLGSQRRVQFIRNDKSVIEIDCTVSETHSRESMATKFEVEDGSTVGDHVILSNQKLKLQGIISDTPIRLERALLSTAVSKFAPPAGVVGAAAGSALVQRLFSAISGSKSPSVKAYEQLQELQEQRQPFTVVTTLKRYESMWITNLSAPRDAGTGRTLTFDLDLEEIRIVSPQTVRLQVFTNPDTSADKAALGKQDKENALVEQFKKGQAAADRTLGIGG